MDRTIVVPLVALSQEYATWLSIIRATSMRPIASMPDYFWCTANRASILNEREQGAIFVTSQKAIVVDDVPTSIYKDIPPFLTVLRKANSTASLLKRECLLVLSAVSSSGSILRKEEALLLSEEVSDRTGLHKLYTRVPSWRSTKDGG